MATGAPASIAMPSSRRWLRPTACCWSGPRAAASYRRLQRARRRQAAGIRQRARRFTLAHGLCPRRRPRAAQGLDQGRSSGAPRAGTGSGRALLANALRPEAALRPLPAERHTGRTMSTTTSVRAHCADLGRDAGRRVAAPRRRPARIAAGIAAGHCAACEPSALSLQAFLLEDRQGLAAAGLCEFIAQIRRTIHSIPCCSGVQRPRARKLGVSTQPVFLFQTPFMRQSPVVARTADSVMQRRMVRMPRRRDRSTRRGPASRRRISRPNFRG